MNKKSYQTVPDLRQRGIEIMLFNEVHWRRVVNNFSPVSKFKCLTD